MVIFLDQEDSYDHGWNILLPDILSCSVNKLIIYLTIRLQAWVFYEQIDNEVQPSWLSLVENEGE